MHLALGFSFRSGWLVGMAWHGTNKREREEKGEICIFRGDFLAANLISAMYKVALLYFEQAKSTQAFYQGFQRYHLRMLFYYCVI